MLKNWDLVCKIILIYVEISKMVKNLIRFERLSPPKKFPNKSRPLLKHLDTWFESSLGYECMPALTSLQKTSAAQALQLVEGVVLFCYVNF